MKSITPEKAGLYKKLIPVLSILIPLVVALLFRVRIEGVNLSFLPPIYAGINGLTAVLLVAAYLAIQKKKVELHRKLMITCMVFSGLFLLMYVAYHITSDPTTFGGTGWLRTAYFIILISHIALSVAIVPLVLYTLLRALLGEWDRHRNLAKITLPIWIYVAVTGVIVYIMISPYYING